MRLQRKASSTVEVGCSDGSIIMREGHCCECPAQGKKHGNLVVKPVGLHTGRQPSWLIWMEMPCIYRPLIFRAISSFRRPDEAALAETGVSGL